MASVYSQHGEHAEALRLLHEGLEIAQRARVLEQIGFYNRRLSENYFFLGDWVSARRHIMDNFQRQLSATRLLESEYMLNLLDGRLEEAAALAHAIAADHRRKGDFPWARYFSAMEAWHNLELDRIEEARAAAAEALGETMPTGWSHGIWFIAEALARGGDDAQCKMECDKLELFGRATNNPYLLAGALAGRAMLAVKRGDLHRGITLLEESLPLTKSLPVLHAYALHTLARVLTRRAEGGDAERVRTLLQECLNLLEQMGDIRKVERVRTEFISLI
jgi:tetratricopeptide (TPR) repeat protein